MFEPWVQRIPWRRKWQPTPVFFQETPMERGAWQTTVRGVTHSDMTEVAAYRVHAHKINQPLTSSDKQAAKSWDPLPWPSASSCPLHAPQQKEKREASHKAISSAPAQATGSTQSCPLESCGGVYKLWGLPLPWRLRRGRCK